MAFKMNGFSGFAKTSTFKTVGVGSPMKASGGSCEEVLASQAYKDAAKSKKYWKRECWTMGSDCPDCPKKKIREVIEINQANNPNPKN